MRQAHRQARRPRWLAALALLAAMPAVAGVDATASGPAVVAGGAATPRRLPGIERDVQRLALQLGLSGAQQATLRGILVAEQLQLRQLWREGTDPPADRVGATAAILEATRARIRAMLTAGQLQRYPAAVSREQLAPAAANLAGWLDRLQPAPGQAAAATVPQEAAR